MALIKLNKDQAIPYVPLFDRKNTKDPLTVYIKYVPAVLHDEFFSKLQNQVSEVTNLMARAEISQAHDKEMFIKQVVKVENFTDQDGKKIDDMSVFYDSIDNNLRSEIIAAMVSQSILTAGQRKNFEGG